MRLALVTMACTAVIGLSARSQAQSIKAPPRQDSTSPTGVSYRSGALSYSEKDLSIGGDGAAGISLTRIYNSGVDFSDPGAGWSYNVVGYVSIAAAPLYPEHDQPPPGAEPYVYNVVFGGKSVGFTGGSIYTSANGSHTGGPVGTYVPTIPSGATLVFNGTTGAGYYTFTDADGTVVNFTQGPNGKISNWTMPDGTRLDYSYSASNGRIQSVFSNRGWALLFESSGTKACAVNLAQSYVTPTSSCPGDAQTVTYVKAAGSNNPPNALLISATRAWGTTTYSYNDKDHLNCVKEPGRATCKVQSTYTACPDDPQESGVQTALHHGDYVTSQQDASGKTYGYSYDNDNSWPVSCPRWKYNTDPDYRPVIGNTTTMVEAGISTVFTVEPSGVVSLVRDPLNRSTGLTYVGGATVYGGFVSDATLVGVTGTEGNAQSDTLDDRGNIVTRTLAPKPNSGLANIVTAASFPSTCTAIKTCNKPTSVTDAKGNVTTYTYDAAHGGILTATMPAVKVNGTGSPIAPVKRYAYALRYAWISNGAGGYVAAATPVWLLASEKTCRTSATVNDACAGGATDEVVTAYDYGPDSGPNNLLLRGVAVTAEVGGTMTTLRTCYGYDAKGRKVSETKPRAGLGGCA